MLYIGYILLQFVCDKIIQFKIVYRLHWSKVKPAKFTSKVDAICDMCRMEQASLSHMFWSCSKFTGFWKSIFCFFSEVLQSPTEPSPITAIFGVPKYGIRLHNSAKRVMAFATLLARRLIKWKDKYPPTFAQWIRDLTHYLTLEKICFSVKGNSCKFNVAWQPVLTWIYNIDPKLMMS